MCRQGREVGVLRRCSSKGVVGAYVSDRGRENDDAEPDAEGCSESKAERDCGHQGDDDLKNVHLGEAPLSNLVPLR